MRAVYIHKQNGTKIMFRKSIKVSES